MAWTPLAERFDAAPLILAGPILRRVDPGNVTVWLALQESQLVTLRVYAREANGQLVERFAGTRRTIRLGDRLHLVAVTAQPEHDAAQLAWGELYFYDVFFQQDERAEPQHLATPGLLQHHPGDPLQQLIYPGYTLPSFLLPPADINALRIMHGSCRKPHGVGHEMLSALDTIIETSIQRNEHRPQQLFLTGDQIYADDVADPLLYALTDCGEFLLKGNEQECLPQAGVAIRTLGPGGRSDVVLKQAMFSTTTPQSHLLSLGEYAAMYLFAWSDVLWPDELPTTAEIWQTYPQVQPQAKEQPALEARYHEWRESLYQFRNLLPRVRRALANIPTYMICDDHEITDDWYLDGAWCQRVLASPVGRRVLRNGLLSYALFQAWGNTPEQFASENGATLLTTVNSWRGEEEGEQAKSIEASVGLPDMFADGGTLHCPAQALQWHYSYHGPRYEVVVMDTRTQRLYRTPDDFPGLLSPDAMHAQVASAARDDAEVSIIISATPVLGIDFIESVQFWSHLRVRDNYAYDREAWALEWGTFQHFLKTVSAMKRVIVLAGDVHYAFGSSMEYWDTTTHATAKIVNYTSSPFHNEGAGAHITVLTAGYPRLVHRIRRHGTATMDFFAWDIASNDHHILNEVLRLIRSRIYLFWWSIPRLLAAHRSPYEIVLPAHGWLKGAFSGFPPDRVYRLRYLVNSLDRPLGKRYGLFKRPLTVLTRFLHLLLEGVTLLESSTASLSRRITRRRTSLEQQSRTFSEHTLIEDALKGTGAIEQGLEKRRAGLVERLLHYASRLYKWKAGSLIIGYNNIGEIHFHWSEHQHTVTQRLWWRSDDTNTLLRTDYHDDLDPPRVEDAPPLP